MLYDGDEQSYCAGWVNEIFLYTLRQLPHYLAPSTWEGFPTQEVILRGNQGCTPLYCLFEREGAIVTATATPAPGGELGPHF